MEHQATVEGVAVTQEERRVPVVILDARDEVVSVFVTRDQAQSIQFALEGEQFERPLTHDLFVDMVTEFGGAIDRVRVDELREGTFMAKLDAEQYVNGERREVTFDLRPSDAIAIALRVDAPIYLTDEVLDAAGEPAETVRFDEE
ncbi:MAG: bifunctional nuclease family protein [Halodesulfurarchaeum sp.]